MHDDDTKAYPLLGSIQNSVGMGFMGNEAVAAIANGLGVRTVTATSTYASARGGIDGRMTATPSGTEFRRAIAFVLAQRPAVLLIGYLPKAESVYVLAEALADYKGLVIVDPVIGKTGKGLYVSEETARAISEQLIPRAQIVVPNRFEAEVLLGLVGDENSNERALLDGLAHRGPETAVVTSFTADAEKREIVNIFSNGYSYHRIRTPMYHGFPAYGVGDVFSGTLAVLIALGASPLSAVLFATAIASRSVLKTTGYGGASVDPVAALGEIRMRGYYEDEDRARAYVRRFDVVYEPISAEESGGARLRFTPPTNKILY